MADPPASPPAEPDRLELGRVGKAHGLKGEVSLVLLTNHSERFVAGATVELDGVPRTIVSARPHMERVLVRFDGVESRTEAETLRGAVITGEPLGDPPEGELWIHQLVGATVRDADGVEHGRVVAVEANPAHDLLVLESGAMIPMPFVVQLADGVVDDAVPEGLL